MGRRKELRDEDKAMRALYGAFMLCVALAIGLVAIVAWIMF